MNLNNYKTVEGVHLLSEFRNDFENAYTKIRDYEGRILSIEEIKKLPFPGNQSQKVKEWKLRANTAIKFRNYIKGQSDKKVLDVGCGNGWFSHFIHSSLINSQVIGLDVNFLELKQAREAFEKMNLHFAYGDIFECQDLFTSEFDYIIFNASIQYFENVKSVIDLMKVFLKKGGEIHVLDSPFYKETDIAKAKRRSIEYYRSTGHNEMIDYYYHNAFEQLENYELLYIPPKSLFQKMVAKQKSPFPWIRINKC